MPSSGIVAVQLGNFEAEYRGSGAKDPIKPRSVFYQWNAKSRELSKETDLPNGNWNWFLCRQVQSGDLNSPAVGFYGKGRRYLLPEDGILEWGNASRSADGQPVNWTKPGQASKDTDLSSDEIALLPINVPFANAYMLTSGKLAGEKAVMESHGKMVKQLPLVSMRRNGEIARTALPGDVVAQIDAFHTSGGVTYLSATGLVVATDRGVFVVKDQSIRRVWCGPNGLNGRSCELVALDISPDGCKIALAPKYASIQVVNVCAKSVP